MTDKATGRATAGAAGPGAAWSRRRAMTVAGAVAGLALAPALARATGATGGLFPGAPPPANPARGLYEWSGVALGAPARLVLHHDDGAAARALLAAAVGEVRRLEGIFSLYRPDSALVRLNRTGLLTTPAAELVELVQVARFWHEATAGAFDPTVQPLWRLYADHFAAPGAAPAGPDRAAVARARARTGMEHVAADPRRLAFARPGMALTLNGIAQGYITDRVAALLVQGGVTRTLVGLGEHLGLGRHPAGRPWRLALTAPGGREFGEADLENQAVATSAGAGTVFDAAGEAGHVLDPATGRPATRVAAVSVIAPTATAADALSTALAVSGPAGAGALAAASATGATGEARAVFLMPDGTVREIAG